MTLSINTLTQPRLLWQQTKMNEKVVINNDDTLKTVLHFSDGVLDVTESVATTSVVNDNLESDQNELNWGPWAMQKSKVAGEKALKVCDYLGESLASFFGITTPKYQYEINEYHRMLKEKEEQREKDLEMGAWRENPTTDIVREQVQSVHTDTVVRH